MKASELIKRLEALIAEYGDKEVGYDGGYGEIYEQEVQYVRSNYLHEMDCFTVNL
jgi:hypothetical protein